MKHLFLLLMLAGSAFGQTIYRNPFTTNGPVELQRSTLRMPVPVILDNDWDDDINNLGTLQMACVLDNLGYIQLLAAGNVNGTVTTNFGPGLAQSVCDYYGVFPRFGQTTNQSAYTNASVYGGLRYLGTNYGSFYETNYQDVIRTYRLALNEARPNSVTYLLQGQCFNLYDLLNSPADDISPLTGLELVSNKVSRIIANVGDYPDSSDVVAPTYTTVNGVEFNLATSSHASRQMLLTNIPANIPVIYVPFYSGTNVLTHTWANVSTENPVYRTYTNYLGTAGRPGWAEITMLYVMAGSTNFQGTPFWTLWQGSNNIAANGSNWWTYTSSGKDYWLSNMVSATTLTNLINAIESHRPPAHGSDVGAFFNRLRLGEVSAQTFKSVLSSTDDANAFYVANILSPQTQRFLGFRWQKDGKDLYVFSVGSSDTNMQIAAFTNGTFIKNVWGINYGTYTYFTVGGAVATITPGASPYTYTNGDGYNEEVFIAGGTISSIKVNGVEVATAQANLATIILAPNETITITYTGVPSMHKKPL